MDLLLTFGLIGLMGVVLPAKRHLRFGAAMTALVLVLAVFQSTGGLGSFSLSSTYLIVAAIATVAILTLRRQNFPWLFVPVTIYLAIGASLIWEPQSGQSGTIANLLFGAAAWSAGSVMGSAYQRDPRAERWLVVVVLLAVGFELVVCSAQTLGFDLFTPSARTIELEGGRSNGTYDHPSTVGKVVTLLLVLVLPATRAVDALTRRLAFFAVIAGVVAIVMTMSRANLVAVSAMVLVWSLVQPRVGASLKRFLLPAAGGVVVLIFLDQILSRFEQGTGERDHFMSVALEQFSRTPWTGVGPGAYVPVVGRFDALTAQGWPVHNIFMLQAVELGVIGAVLFFLPFAAVTMRSAGRWRVLAGDGDFARAIIAYVPALAAIGWTGWGWLLPDTLFLACFVFAFANAQMSRVDPSSISKSLRVPSPRKAVPR